jgi:hypothetical protein
MITLDDIKNMVFAMDEQQATIAEQAATIARFREFVKTIDPDLEHMTYDAVGAYFAITPADMGEEE